MSKYLILFLFLLLSNLSVQAEVDRPGLYGFAPAYPVDVPELFSSDAKPPYMTIETQYVLFLDVDNKGKIKSLNSVSDKDSQVWNYFEKYFSDCKFEPALLDEKKVSSIVPVKITINPRIQNPDFYFPIDLSLQIKDPALYYMTYQYNNITMPSVKYFPKYFCNIDWNDSLDIYPLILLQLELDKAGEVINVKEILSTYSNYTMTLMSASLWSEFIPAIVNDSEIASSPFLLVSLFPQLFYPTQKYFIENFDSLSLHNKLRVKLIPDSISILQKPIPRSIEANSISISNIPLWLNDTLSLHITVDTTGRTMVNRAGKTNKDTYRILKDVFSRVEFYPAIDFDGNPLEYSGMVRLIIKGSEKVRIEYLW